MPARIRQDPGSPTPEHLATRIHSAAIHLLRRLRAEDPATGLTPTQASALSVMVFGGPVSLSALAKAEQVRVPTMSRVVAGLVRSGLVERGQDPHDKRAQRLKATPKGRTLLEAGRARRVRVLSQDLERLPRDRFRALATALETLERLARPVAVDASSST